MGNCGTAGALAWAEPTWQVGATGSHVITAKHFASSLGGDLFGVGEEVENAFELSKQGDSGGFHAAGVEPLGEAPKIPERRSRGGGSWGVGWDGGRDGIAVQSEEPRPSLGKIAAVCEEIPETGEATQLSDGVEIQETILKDFIGWFWAVDHAPFGVVPDDGGAAQSFENSDLDLLGAESHE